MTSLSLASGKEEDIIIIIPPHHKNTHYKNRFLPFLPTFISISRLITYVSVYWGFSYSEWHFFPSIQSILSFIHPSTSNSLPSTLHPQNRHTHTKIKGKGNHCCIFFCFLFLFLVNSRRCEDRKARVFE